MPYILSENSTSKRTYVLVPKGLWGNCCAIGRKDCQIIVEDKSISRKHAHIFVAGNLDADISNPQVLHEVKLEDVSRYGTRVDGTKIVGTTVTLASGVTLKFGVQPCTWSLQYLPLVLFASSECVLSTISGSARNLGAHVVTTWSDSCTHSVWPSTSPDGTESPEVAHPGGGVPASWHHVSALLSGQPTCRPEWIASCAGRATPCEPLPDPQSDRPIQIQFSCSAGEKSEFVLINESQNEWRNRRRQLFSGMKFVFSPDSSTSAGVCSSEMIAKAVSMTGADVTRDTTAAAPQSSESESIAVFERGSDLNNMMSDLRFSRATTEDRLLLAVLKGAPLDEASLCVDLPSSSCHNTLPTLSLNANPEGALDTNDDIKASKKRKTNTPKDRISKQNKQNKSPEDTSECKISKHEDGVPMQEESKPNVKPNLTTDSKTGVERDSKSALKCDTKPPPITEEFSKPVFEEPPVEADMSVVAFASLIKSAGGPSKTTLSQPSAASLGENFKRFVKTHADKTMYGNTFKNLVPFASDPYKESGAQDDEFLREEEERSRDQENAEALFQMSAPNNKRVGSRAGGGARGRGRGIRK